MITQLGPEVDLAEALALSELDSAHLNLPRSALEHFDRLDLGRQVARASQDTIIAADGMELLSPSELHPLTEWCREALRPDGVLVVRMARGGPMEPRALKALFASCFAAVELFAWDGFIRTPAGAGHADVFAICRAFLPYATRSLDLLQPRIVATGSEWQSTWLCEQPTLPSRFLLRATLDVIGEAPCGVDLRFRFLAPERARFKLEGHLSEVTSGSAELLLSSQRAEARGDPRWVDVERIAIDVRTEAEEPVDVRISDVRICCGSVRPSPSVSRTSAVLRGGYDAGYYRGMPGYDQPGERRELHNRVNVHRAYALLLSRAPRRVVDVGAGRGELARHLLEQGAEVTLLDYSPAAMEHAKALVGERPGARFVVDDAANLASHVPEQSQDAIFMTDFVEHVTVEELRHVLSACRRVLAPGGALLIHTPERYSGSIVTAKAIHGLHMNLFEIGTLEALLLESFAAVDVFTWNGVERFHEPGYCIDLFALVRPEAPYVGRPLSALDAGAGDGAEAPYRTAWVFERPQLPARFLLDATVDISPPSAEGELDIAFLAVTGEHLARVRRDLSELQTLPARLRLASELLIPGSSAGWEAVERVVVSAASRHGQGIEIAVSDVWLGHATPAERGP